jgi:adenylate cyclase
MLARIRLYSGLVLFFYVALHLANHMLGVISVDAMNAALPFIVKPWRTLPGTVLLGGAALLHTVAAFVRLYQRRTLRMHPWQLAQYVLGLLIPFLLMGHALASRGLHEVFAAGGNYYTEYLALFVIYPGFGVLQAVLLVVVWMHGCIGIHTWLRLKPWYAARQYYIFALAVLWPAFALAGYIAGGMQVARRAVEPGWIERIIGEARMNLGMFEWVLYWQNRGLVIAALVIASVFLLRTLRERRAAGAAFTLRYHDRLNLPVRRGMSVLEALRAARVPHASVCGGRGRCSTCRIHVNDGVEKLPAPEEGEQRVLRRISAPASVRLACQLRPQSDLAVTPLLPPSATAADAMDRARSRATEERAVAVLFADMRGFTRLAESRLPYDVVFVLNRFREEMAHAIESAGGVVNEFVGDSVMALFGLESDVETGCRQAAAAARAMLDRLEQLNRTLHHELREPLRIGIGIHAGPVIVGEMGYPRLKGITVVGDVVNTASRLEEMTKRLGSQVVMSHDAAVHVKEAVGDWQRHEVEVRGKAGTMTVLMPSPLKAPERL